MLHLFEVQIFAADLNQAQAARPAADNSSLQRQRLVITHLLTHSWHCRIALLGANIGQRCEQEAAFSFLCPACSLSWERHDDCVWERGVFDSTGTSLGVDDGDYFATGNNPGGSVDSQCINCSHEAIAGALQVYVAL